MAPASGIRYVQIATALRCLGRRVTVNTSPSAGSTWRYGTFRACPARVDSVLARGRFGSQHTVLVVLATAHVCKHAKQLLVWALPAARRQHRAQLLAAPAGPLARLHPSLSPYNRSPPSHMLLPHACLAAQLATSGGADFANPTHDSIWKVTRQLKKEQLSLYNCLASVLSDAAFVSEIRALYPTLPLLANLRCGLWYARQPDGTCEQRRAWPQQ